MISEGQFKGQFEQLEASFGRTLPQKLKDGWFKEVEDCDFRTFKQAMRRLIMGDKFPHFQEFWIQYRNQTVATGEGAGRGCKDCRHGYLHFVKDGFDVTAFCSVCWPHKRGSRDPRYVTDHQLGMEPHRTNNSVMIPPTVAKAMIHELQEKMGKPGIDWEKEVEEAWELHEKAT